MRGTDLSCFQQPGLLRMVWLVLSAIAQRFLNCNDSAHSICYCRSNPRDKLEWSHGDPNVSQLGHV